MLFSKQTKRSELKPSDSPGPGSYQPRLPDGHRASISFDKQLVGDRNEALKCPDGPLPEDNRSPPPTKANPHKSSANADRKFSWANEKIHTLTAQLDAANAKIKDHDRVIDQLKSSHQGVVSDCQQRVDQAEEARSATAVELISSKKETEKSSAEIEDLRRKLAGAESEIVAEKLRNQATEAKLTSDAAEMMRRYMAEAQRSFDELKSQSEHMISGLRADLASQAEANKAEVQTVVDAGRREREDLRIKMVDQANAMHSEVKWLEAQHEKKNQEIKLANSKLSAYESELGERKAAFLEAEKRVQSLSGEIQSLGRVASETSNELSTERQRSASYLSANEKLQAKLQESQSLANQMRTEGARLVAEEAELRSKLQAGEEKLSLAAIAHQIKSDEINKLRSLLSDGEDRVKDLEHYTNGLEAKIQSITAAYEKANERALRAEKVAIEAEAAVLESRRLHDENHSLNQSVAKLNGDLQAVNNSLALGHKNNKQKIQYHLRLKQELEEMRTELAVLLRDKFILEQCVRYLSSKSGGRAAGVSASTSLAPSTLFTTPIAQKTMRLGARGKGCDQGTVYADSTKEDIERSIESAKKRTADEVAGFSSPNGEVSPNNDMTAASIQARIVAKIAQVLAPPSTKSSSASLARSDLVSHVDQKDQGQAQKANQVKVSHSSVSSNLDSMARGMRGSIFRA